MALSGSKENNGWLVVLAVLLVGILAVVAFNAGTASNAPNISVSTSPDAQLKTLNVSGSVTKMVTPDKVDVVLSVQTLDLSAQKSQSDNAALSSQVMTALKGAGVADSQITTISYSENEEFQYSDILKKSESVGYRTTNQIKVTLTDTTKAGSIVDAAVQAGANSVDGITFGLSDAKELSVREQALAEASATAKAKADSIARGLNVTLGKVHSISETNYNIIPNYTSYDTSKAVAGSAMPPTPITAGQVEVDATVSVAFELS